MKISKIYTYPIKGMRATELENAVVTKHGFPYDRRYMLLEVAEDGSYKNMAIAYYPLMSRYFPVINDDESFTLSFRPADGEEKSIKIPLKPKVDGLEEVEVTMHKSPTKAYKMEQKYNDWFSSTFGFDCVLVYLGSDMRKVLMSVNGNATKASAPGGWLSSISSKATQLVTGAGEQENKITFADCAPYLVVSEKSMDDVHSRMNDGSKYDIMKFRPNIIVSGAEEVWEEDFWGELTIDGKTKIECEHNCARCKSLNIDYDTGKPGTGESGSMLKKLASNRRVDPGMKWSPVFGRYSFLDAASEGNEIKVGDEVVVSKRNDERTKFDWEGLHTLK
ncbi:hypothetical protein LTR17_002616 [Elasticomyces elasticus]|nr:hypothetical protein LTR17_002616 [Elasticomyces elasticus]